LTRDRSVLNPANANREIYKMLRDGVKVPIKKEDGSEEIETIKVIDFNNPDKNDFFLASQFWITGEMYKKRAVNPDVLEAAFLQLPLSIFQKV